MAVQTRKRKAELEQAAEKNREAARADPSPKRQKLPMRSKADDLPAHNPSTKGTLTTFDDGADQPLDAPSLNRTIKPNEPSTSEHEDSDDSDDEAPEAVSTAQAASEMKKSTQAAQKAAREQAAAEKRKRQERDARLKKQAEERKRADGAEPGLSKDGDSGAPPAKTQAGAARRKRPDRVEVPDLLPLELLIDASSSEDEGDDGEPGKTGAQSGRRTVSAVEKRLTRLDKGPQDERIGSTLYRVAPKLDERLTPKVKRLSLSARDRLLQRKRTAIARPGFLIKR